MRMLLGLMLGASFFFNSSIEERVMDIKYESSEWYELRERLRRECCYMDGPLTDFVILCRYTRAVQGMSDTERKVASEWLYEELDLGNQT